MACPHGSGQASACSQCLGVTARHVTQDGQIVFVDGLPERRIEPSSSGYGLKAAIRGGRAKALATRKL